MCKGADELRIGASGSELFRLTADRDSQKLRDCYFCELVFARVIAIVRRCVRRLWRTERIGAFHAKTGHSIALLRLFDRGYVPRRRRTIHRQMEAQPFQEQT